jgi:hypothetical protein
MSRSERFKKFMKTNRTIFRVLLLSSLLAVLVCVTTDPLDKGHPAFTHPKTYPYDLHKYLYMADHPFSLRIAPFGYRILMPLVVHLLPADRFAAFYACTVFSLILTAALVFFILRAMRFSTVFSCLGMLVFYSTGYLARFNVFATWHVDAFSFLFVALGFWFVLKNRPAWLAVTLLVGMLAKETVLFILPLYYTFRAARLFDGRLVLKTLMIGLPALSLWFSMRLVFPPLNQDERYLRTIPYEVSVVHVISDDPAINRTHEPGKLLREIGLKRFKEMSAANLKRVVFGVWGAMLFLVLAAPKENLRFLAKGAPFLLLVYGQLLFGSNTERLLALSFPVVIPMILAGFHRIQTVLNVHPCFLFLLPAVIFLLDLSLRSDYRFSPELRIQNLVLLGWFVLLFMISGLSKPSAKPPGI